MTCRLCETRKPRRFCPGVHGEICAPCCGTEREVTVNCPLDCEYLLEARRHEKMRQLSAEDIPNMDIQITETYLNEIDPLLRMMSQILLAATLQTPGAMDRDIQSALEAMIKTHRTAQSGLIYETKPENIIAGMIQQRMQGAIEEYRENLTRQAGMSTLRDADVLGSLVFLQRMALHLDNGRVRGRSLISYLLARQQADLAESVRTAEAEPPSLLVP